MLGLRNKTNDVRVNQQTFHAVHKETYGFFTVVNDAYFDMGPTVGVCSLGVVHLWCLSRVKHQTVVHKMSCNSRLCVFNTPLGKYLSAFIDNLSRVIDMAEEVPPLAVQA